MKSIKGKGRAAIGVLALTALTIVPFAGCQVTRNGQTLPSPYYLDDDIQYHPAGSEFQYQQEVDHMNKINAERAAASYNGQY